MQSCTCFEEFMRIERALFDRRLKTYQRRMSEREGREVTRREAQAEYMATKLKSDAKRFRHYFCSRCPRHEECGWKPEEDSE